MDHKSDYKIALDLKLRYENEFKHFSWLKECIITGGKKTWGICLLVDRKGYEQFQGKLPKNDNIEFYIFHK